MADKLTSWRNKLRQCLVTVQSWARVQPQLINLHSVFAFSVIAAQLPEARARFSQTLAKWRQLMEGVDTNYALLLLFCNNRRVLAALQSFYEEVVRGV